MMRVTKLRKLRKKEYFTFMFLPGPNERVRTLSISKSALKTALLSVVAVVILSLYLVYEYNEAQDKVWELQSVREELMQQKAQVQSFALNLLDYKRQMFLLRDLDTKLRRVVSLGPRDRAQQALGIGGPDELGLQNLTQMGEMKQEEALKEMHQELSQLKGAATRQETSLQMLIEYFEDKRSLYASTPSIWPVRGWVTSPFGPRTSPFSGIPTFHEGMDIAAQTGTPVIAPADGVVVKAEFSPGYGNMVEISHGYGLKTIFGHNSRLNVKAGQQVRRGDVISYVGDTGSSTGPHLHYEVRLNGLPVNPVKYLN
ncbi:MAG TPA: peptidoglycan DD-metalloendopeptidase family protein [Nitrospirota bacterium]|nr:peptidoglycan DD-metalloendopeptidase family protein [Nitrospirota bacterium]